MKKKVIIIGGGFGGLSAAKELKNADVEITLIDKTNHYLFQPLLYQVATAALSPADIAAPIRSILRNQKNTRVILGEVTNIDLFNKKVFLNSDGFDYDYLIVAVGSILSYFSNSDWAKYAPGLKTINDALQIRENILLSFERAEKLSDRNKIDQYLTFVIVGGGPTGVELAGAISEIARKTLLKDFRNIDPSKTKVILVEAMDRILYSFHPKLSERAKNDLEKLGVTVLLNKKVSSIDSGGVKLDGNLIETKNVIWAAGNVIPSIINNLNAETDKMGRVIVESDCSIKNFPDVFVIGDAAHFEQNGIALPGIAPVALQQGRFVSNIISKQLTDRPKFNYIDKGILATIGKAKAVMQIGKFNASGWFAWILWVFVHIFYLIGFRNRYKVLSEWVWLYFTNRNGIRLITKQPES